MSSSSATPVDDKPAAKRAASASSSGADGDETQRELKRTRPIKACQACRAKKVKCILKPDEPVCEQCAASGKTCLFRVDDLCPTLRRERFAAYGPPSANARVIAGKKGKGGGGKARTASSGADETDDASDSQARQRRKTDDEARPTGPNGKPAKAKAVFRSFANPTNLAAPSAAPLKREEPAHAAHAEMPFAHPAERPSPAQHAVPMGHYRSASQHSQGSAHSLAAPRPPLPHTSSAGSAVSYSPSEPPQMLPSFRLAFSGASGSHAPPPHVPPPHAGYAEAPRRTSFFAASPPASSLRSTGVEARDFAVSPGGSLHHDGGGVPVSQAFSPVSRWYAQSERQPGEAFPEFASPSPGKWQRAPSFTSNMGAPSPGTWAMSTFVAGATPGQEPPREEEHVRTAPGRERFGAPPGSADSTSAVVRAPLREMPPPERPGSSGARVGRPIGAADDARPRFIVDTPQDEEEELDGDALRRQRAPGVKKIALPFFRWFGATANTPGIRRIKVGVYHEADLDLQEESAAATPAAGLPAAPAAASPPDPERGPRSVETMFHNTPREHAGVSVSPQATGASQAGAASSSHRPREWGRAGGAESTVSASTRELFEPDRPRYPRRALLQELVPLFLRYFRCSFFPWLDSEELLALVHSSEMPALLANAICAVTARFSTRPELIARGAAKSCGEPFAEMAKILLVPMLSWPSIDVIEALVILSYSEFGAGADAGLWMYVGMALRMSVDLGLQHEATVASMANARQQERARWLFWSVICLDRITTFGTGRPVTMREDEFDLVLPPLTEDAQSNLFVAGHIVRCLMRRGRIGDLLNRADDIAPQERGKRLHALWTDLVEYYDALPQPLHFSVSTFQRAMTADQGPAFIYLHVLLQSTMSLINRPQLLRRFESSFVAAPTPLASIAAHASSTIVSILRFAEDARHDRTDRLEDGTRRDFNQFLDTSPYLDQLILPCGRAFLAERQDVRDALRRLGYTPASASRPQSREGVDAAWGPLHSSRQYAEANLASCQLVLNRLATYWGGAAWPARALEQESAGATEDVDPDARDEDAQPAPVRDLEMVLRWARARARVKRARAATQTPGQSRRGSVAAGAEPDTGEPAPLLATGDTNSDGPSPLGLGFSGTFGSDIDVEALISAWASENTGGIGLGQAQPLAPQWQPPQQQPQQPQQPQQQTAGALPPPPGALPDFAFNVAGGSPFDLGTMQLEELFSDEVFPVDLLEGDGDVAPPALLNAFFPRASGPPAGPPPHLAPAAQHHSLHPAYPPP